MWIVCKKRGGLCRLTESVCVVASNKRGWKAYTTFTSYGMERHHLTDNINMWIVCKKRGGLCRLTESVCVVASNKRGWKAYTTFTSCENVAYSNKVFFLCWVGYALEGSIFSLSKCDFSRRFYTERS